MVWNNHFLLNVAKTGEMVVDFRTKLSTISILGEGGGSKERKSGDTEKLSQEKGGRGRHAAP